MGGGGFGGGGFGNGGMGGGMGAVQRRPCQPAFQDCSRQQESSPQSHPLRLLIPRFRTSLTKSSGPKPRRVTGKQAGQVFAQVKDPLPRKGSPVFNNDSLKNLKKKQG